MECAITQLPLKPRNYRSFVGGPNQYDIIGALQFNLLVLLGMRENHTLLDIGCGSLRGGRFAILYLRPGHYCGIEPESWLVEDGSRHNLGPELVSLKQPSFLYDSSFTCTGFGRKFDFLIAHSIFSHAAPGQIDRCLSEAAKTMHAQSLFLATYNRGASSYEGTDWVYPSVTYTEERFRQMADEQGLEVRRLRCPHPGGQTWVLLAPRPNTARLDRIASTIALQGPAMPSTKLEPRTCHSVLAKH
jgi:hypothetical protein